MHSQIPKVETRRQRRHRAQRTRRRRLAIWAVVVLVGIVTFILRAVHLDRSWDIFVDEISYLRISQSVAENQEVKLYDNAFYLHPPLFFFLEGIFVKASPPGGDLVHQIYNVRYVNVVLASLTALGLLGIGQRVAGWLAGVVVALTFALDPFIIKMNSRNYLDTAAMLWVVLGYYVLFSALTDEKRQLPLWRVLAAGFLFGLALLSKEMTVFITLLPLAVCFFAKWAIPRQQAVLAGGVTALVYVPYPIIVYAIGDWRDFSYQKLQGVSRLAGLLRITGFRAEGPSFLHAVLANLQQFATTYALLATGGISIIILFFFFGGAARRLLLAWTASSYTLLIYVVIQGTLEEQFFYLLVIPALLSTVLTVKLILDTNLLVARRRRTAATGTLLFVFAAFLFWSSYIWAQVHFIPDNGYERVDAYIREEIPKEKRIGVVGDTEEFLLKDRMSGKYSSAEELQAHHVDYIVVSSKLAEQGYAPSPEFYHWITEHGEPVYSFEGRSFGLIGVYQLA